MRRRSRRVAISWACSVIRLLVVLSRDGRSCCSANGPSRDRTGLPADLIANIGAQSAAYGAADGRIQAPRVREGCRASKHQPKGGYRRVSVHSPSPSRKVCQKNRITQGAFMFTERRRTFDFWVALRNDIQPTDLCPQSFARPGSAIALTPHHELSMERHPMQASDDSPDYARLAAKLLELLPSGRTTEITPWGS